MILKEIFSQWRATWARRRREEQERRQSWERQNKLDMQGIIGDQFATAFHIAVVEGGKERNIHVTTTRGKDFRIAVFWTEGGLEKQIFEIVINLFVEGKHRTIAFRFSPVAEWEYCGHGCRTTREIEKELTKYLREYSAKDMCEYDSAPPPCAA